MLDYSKTSASPVASPQIATSASESQAIQENLAKVAVVLDQLSKAVVALRDQVAKLETEVGDVRPQIIAFKVHSESFPHALREARRSDNAVQKSIEDVDARLRELEARVNGNVAAR